MNADRRGFLKAGLVISVLGPELSKGLVAGKGMKDNRKLGLVYNNDLDNILYASSGKDITPEEYRRAVGHLLRGRPNILAQNVGLPDPVIYRSQVATTHNKYLAEVSQLTWPNEKPTGELNTAAAVSRLLGLGTDPLAISIETCRQHDVMIVASYRMNSEDWYQNNWMLSDFGRAHPKWRIPGAGCLDPAVPEVYEHRMKIFAEVAQQYDFDGIEFDFRRHIQMISNPRQNYPVLTRMVRETRRMLDETARRKGRQKLLLGVRVGPSLADPPGTEYPGGNVKTDLSCRDLGLDVETWIEEELVDYVCPSLFWPRFPGVPKTAEFVALAKTRNVGIYPTVFPIPHWIDEGPLAVEDVAKRLRYRGELAAAALQCYRDRADGISTFNWVQHHQPGMVKNPMRKDWGLGCIKEQMAILPHLASASALKQYLRVK